jgi:ribosomal protein S17E
MSLEALERKVIVAALTKFHGNQSNAARYLSITRKVLMNRIAKYQIQKTEMQGDSKNESHQEQAAASPGHNGHEDPPDKTAYKQAT